MVKHVVKLPKRHKTALACLCFMMIVLLFLPSERADAVVSPSLEVGKAYALALQLEAANEATVETEELEQVVVTVGAGDNLARLLDRQGFTPQNVYWVTNSGKAAKKLTRIRPGDRIVLSKDSDGKLEQLAYDLSATEKLVIQRQGKKYSANIEQHSVEVTLDYVSGQIRSNFWAAGIEAGMTDNQIMSLADIFSWDIDFALEIRTGDEFHMLYEKRYINGEFVGFGNILAAEFINQGDSYAAVRFKDGSYYTPDGRSMRKSFLRAPVNFKYISSNFSRKRFHPVQKRYKAHRGIDYAASTGTPVVAAGNGKVIKSSYNRFNGHYVFIQHGERYVTKYLHFSKRAVKTGATVKQGQVIGYVGATGLAAGPHLHYEFIVNGKHRNPRTVKLPKANPIAASEKQQFLAVAAQQQQRLNNSKRVMLALKLPSDRMDQF